MPYFPVIPTHDDRRAKQGAVPINLVNAYVERVPVGAGKQSELMIVPTPGRTRLATLAANVRGLFCESGCQDGDLFASTATTIYRVSSAWAASSIGSFATDDGNVVMRAFRADLTALAFTKLKHFDGATFSTITDVDAPASASTLAVAGFRIIAAETGGDAFGWSKAGATSWNDWDPNGQAADIDVPDSIRAQEEINGDLWNFNATSIKIWQATGLDEANAFAPAADIREVGIAGRDLSAKVGAGRMFLGNDLVPYKTGGLSIGKVPNRDLTVALGEIDPDVLALRTAWSYKDGEREFFAISAGLEKAHVFDDDLGLWHTRARYKAPVYDVDFVVLAYGQVIVASRLQPYLWALDADVLTDDGDPILREMTVKVPATGDVPVDRLRVDGTWRAQPLTGQGSAPEIMLEVSMDNGENWCDPRVVRVPAAGENFRVQDFGFGLASAEHGCLIRLTMSDPFGFAIYGIGVNESVDEAP